jgi:hypothetical protein
MSRLSKASKAASAGKPRYLYGHGDDFGDWEAWAVCTDDPHREKRIYYVTHRAWPDGTVDRAAWTQLLLMDALQCTLDTFHRAYGGLWHLEVREPKPPGKPGHHRAPSFAQVSRCSSFPPAAPRTITATRAELDALDKPLPPAEHEDQSDEQFFEAHPDDDRWEQG